MIYHNIKQNSDEWLILRAGKITSSNLAKIMANYGGAFGDPAKKYAVDICVELLTGRPVSSGYSNGDMERGHEEEPLARMRYEQEMFCTVENGGFFDCGDIGCSPDGLVGDEGLIEIKSAIPSVHYDRIRKRCFDTAYRWQIVGNLKLTERKWIDFISYCDQFPEDKKLFVYRIESGVCEEEFNKIDVRVDQFRELINSTMKTITESEYIV